jgi:hypothetical protein
MGMGALISFRADLASSSAELYAHWLLEQPLHTCSRTTDTVDHFQRLHHHSFFRLRTSNFLIARARCLSAIAVSP